MKQATELSVFLKEHGFRRHALLQNKVGHFHIAGQLNEHPVDILLDTGAASTVVDLNFCKEKGISTHSTGKLGGGAGSVTMAIHVLDGAVLRLDELPLKADGIYAIDLSDVNQGLTSRGADRVDAIIGVDILRFHQAIIDYATMSLFLRHG